MEQVRFETKDRQGRQVRLRESVYQRHLPDRPEMADYVREASRAIEDPDIELQNDQDGSYIYCRFGLGRDAYEKCFVKVFVHFGTNRGEVATYFLTTRVGAERVVWQRTP